MRQAARSRRKSINQPDATCVARVARNKQTGRQSMNAGNTSAVAPKADRQTGMRQPAWRLSMQRDAQLTIKSVNQASRHACKQEDRYSIPRISRVEMLDAVAQRLNTHAMQKRVLLHTRMQVRGSGGASERLAGLGVDADSRTRTGSWPWRSMS